MYKFVKIWNIKQIFSYIFNNYITHTYVSITQRNYWSLNFPLGTLRRLLQRILCATANTKIFKPTWTNEFNAPPRCLCIPRRGLRIHNVNVYAASSAKFISDTLLFFEVAAFVTLQRTGLWAQRDPRGEYIQHFRRIDWFRSIVLTDNARSKGRQTKINTMYQRRYER